MTWMASPMKSPRLKLGNAGTLGGNAGGGGASFGVSRAQNGHAGARSEKRLPQPGQEISTACGRWYSGFVDGGVDRCGRVGDHPRRTHR